MNDIVKKIQELEEIYIKKNTNIPIDPYVRLKVSFPKKYKLTEEFLNEFKDFDFNFFEDNFINKSYISDIIPKSLAERLYRVLREKTNLPYSYDTKEKTINDLIERNSNNLSIYLEHDINRKKDNKMGEYYKNLFEFEQETLKPHFKEDYCNELYKVLKDCSNHEVLNAKFKTPDPLKSFILEIYESFEQIFNKNIIELQSISYPYMYLIDNKILSNLDNSRYNIGLNEMVLKSLYNKFDGINKFKNNKKFNEMLDFKSNLDIFQASEEDHINSYFSKENLENRQQKLTESLIYLIYKNVYEVIKFKNAHELNEQLLKIQDLNICNKQIEEFFKDKIDFNDKELLNKIISSEKNNIINDKKEKNTLKNS